MQLGSLGLIRRLSRRHSMYISIVPDLKEDAIAQLVGDVHKDREGGGGAGRGFRKPSSPSRTIC